MGSESENVIFPGKIVKDLHVFSNRIQSELADNSEGEVRGREGHGRFEGR